MTAREIGERLGVSRNAIYQQIQAMRKKGALDPDYTPSGQTPREFLAGPEGVSTQLMRQMARTADELERLAQDLRSAIG